MAEAWFSPDEPAAEFKFYTSPADDLAYTLYTPKKRTVNGDKKKVPYYGNNLPSGTRYVKIEFNDKSTNAAIPQIRKVSFRYMTLD